MSATLNPIAHYQISPGKALLTPDQAAQYLHVKVQTLANWRGVGRGPVFVRVGRLIRYRLDALDKWIAANDGN